MTLKLLHKRIKFAENMSVEILASKFLVVMGTYRRLSHTVLSCIFPCVRISEQDVDVGDLPVLTFGNCVLKSPVKLYVRFLTFLKTFFNVFLQNPKHDFFTFFELLHTFSRTLPLTTASTTRSYALQHVQTDHQQLAV